MPDRQVVIEWPESMRIGEDETITLVFEPVLTNSASIAHSVGYPDIYSFYNLMAEARYDVSGVRVTPANPIRESLPEGEKVKFTWRINAVEEGMSDGTIWLSLRYLPLDGRQASQVPIFIHQVVIRTSSLFGLNEVKAYLLGGVGVVLAAAIVYDDLLDMVLRKNRKKATRELQDTKV